MTQQTSDNAVHLTQDAFDKLKSELERWEQKRQEARLAREKQLALEEKQRALEEKQRAQAAEKGQRA